MLILLGILIFLELSLALELPRNLADFAAPFHRACRAFAPLSAEAENYRALVCGAPLADLEMKSELARTGLLHLLIVSGSHIIFLERIWRAICLSFPRLSN